jgi:hypothetical protein
MNTSKPYHLKIRKDKEQMPQNRYTKPLYQFSSGQTINSSVEFYQTVVTVQFGFSFEPNIPCIFG